MLSVYTEQLHSAALEVFRLCNDEPDLRDTLVRIARRTVEGIYFEVHLIIPCFHLVAFYVFMRLLLCSL